MPNIYFECPQCAQPIDAPDELANQLIECPACQQTIEVPARSQRKELPKPVENAPKHSPSPMPATVPEVRSSEAEDPEAATFPIFIEVTAKALLFFGVFVIIAALT